MAEMQATPTGFARVADQFRAFSTIPMVRQAGALLGLAGAIALAASAVLWLQEPNWRQLEANLPLTEQAQVLDALGAAGIDYTLGAGGTAIMVPADRLYEAKMTLATSGLAAPAAEGYALLDQDQGIGSSRRMESTRFRRALEGELARSIESLAGVQQARVHLAIPERSVFLRSQAEPTASVVLTRYRGGKLAERQIAGIQQLVAASVPELTVDGVAVLDPYGNLLSKDASDDQFELTSTQFTLKRDLERQYVARVENMLAPLLGADGFRADVALDMIFRQTEIAQEQYTNPAMENGGVRSERWQRKLRPEGAGGVPGALTNAPPEAGLLAEEEVQGTAVQNRASEVQAEVLRNYELNKTIRYERPSPWEIQSLSVAVVINQRPPNAEGQAQPRTAAQLQALEAIIRDAVGLNANRGDTVTVTEAPFVVPELVEEPAPEGAPLISAQSIEGILRQGLPGIALLALVLFVLRPFMKSVMTLPPPPKPPKDDPYMQLSAPPGMPALPPPTTPEARARAISAQEMAKMNEWLDEARTMAQDDPRRIAQLTRQWMNSDG